MESLAGSRSGARASAGEEEQDGKGHGRAQERELEAEGRDDGRHHLRADAERPPGRTEPVHHPAGHRRPGPGAGQDHRGDQRDQHARADRGGEAALAGDGALAHVDAGQDAGGEVGGELRELERAERVAEGLVGLDQRLAGLARRGVGLDLGGLGVEQHPVEEPLGLRVGEVSGEAGHGETSVPASETLSRARARCSQVMTVPMGTSMASAISL